MHPNQRRFLPPVGMTGHSRLKGKTTLQKEASPLLEGITFLILPTGVISTERRNLIFLVIPKTKKIPPSGRNDQALALKGKITLQKEASPLLEGITFLILPTGVISTIGEICLWLGQFLNPFSFLPVPMTSQHLSTR